MDEDLPFMPPAIMPRVQDLMDVNVRDYSQLAKIKARVRAERSVVPQLDPMSAQDIPAWLHANKPEFPIHPGSYGPQLLKDIEREFLPSPSDSEDSATMKVQKALMMATMGSPGGSGPATLAAVKGKGGMWHPAAPQNLSEAMKGAMLRGREDMVAAPGMELPGEVPHYDWANKATSNYLNKHAGTATDPLNNVMIPHGQGTIRWEDAMDSLVHSKTAKQYIEDMPHSGDTGTLGKAPPNEKVWNIDHDMAGKVSRDYKEWLTKNKLPQLSMDELHPEGSSFREHGTASDTYKALNNQQRMELEEFGNRWADAQEGSNPVRNYLGHVGDHLHQNVPLDQLNRYDLVRAVQETAARDAARVKKMNSVEGRSEGTIPHKEYPDKFRWVEVKSKEALDREGNQMGHCVGGYCDYVESGHSKIYSLRDPKGQSHVTIEVRPPDPRLASNSPDNLKHHPKFSQEWADIDGGKSAGGKMLRYQAWQHKVQGSPEFAEWLRAQPADIQQIKGKQNKAPTEEYQKYVQDFIKSGPLDHPNAGKTSLSKAEYESGQRLPAWGDVHDLHNTGLFKYNKTYMTRPEARDVAVANIQKRLAEVEKGVGHGDERQYTTSYNKDQLNYNLKQLLNPTGNVDSAMHFGVGLYDK